MPEVRTFPRREVAERRVEWIIQPPQADAGTADYDRFENDRLAVMRLIAEEFGGAIPQDIRVIDHPDGHIISYVIQRVILPGDH